MCLEDAHHTGLWRFFGILGEIISPAVFAVHPNFIHNLKNQQLLGSASLGSNLIFVFYRLWILGNIYLLGDLVALYSGD